MSFYSGDLYRDVAYNWRGLALGTLILVTAFSSVLLTIVFYQAQVLPYLEEIAPKMIRQLPLIYLRDGIAETPQAKRYEIFDEDLDKMIAVIDTSVDDIPSDLGGAANLFIGRQSYGVKLLEEQEMREIKFVQGKSFDIDQELCFKMLDAFSFWVRPFSFVLIMSLLLFYRMIQLLFMSLGGYIVAKIHQMNLGYFAVLRITLVACIPAFLVDSIVGFYEITHLLTQLFIFSLFGFYIVYGFAQVRKPISSGDRYE